MVPEWSVERGWSPGHSRHWISPHRDFLHPLFSDFEMQRSGGKLKPTLSDSSELKEGLEQMLDTVMSIHQALGDNSAQPKASDPRAWEPQISQKWPGQDSPTFQGERSQALGGCSRLIYSCPAHGLYMGRTLSSSTKWCLTRDMLGCLQLHFTSRPAPLPIRTLTPMHYLESVDKASTQFKYFPNFPRVQDPFSVQPSLTIPTLFCQPLR